MSQLLGQPTQTYSGRGVARAIECKECASQRLHAVCCTVFAIDFNVATQRFTKVH